MAPELAVADGALGFWQAIEEVWPKTRCQRCWVHYADFRIMPRQCTSSPSNEALHWLHIGIIRAAPGWQTASELAGIGRCW